MQKRENNQAKDARSAALTVLLRCERNGAWLDGALKSVLKESALEPRDAALCSKLCYGVCQNRLLLEFWLSKFSKVKPEKLEPAVRIALLLAMYQITMLDKIPPRAAVNEAVNLARRNSKNPRSPTLVNGILRSFCRAQENLPQPDDLATKYSHPQWLVDLLSQAVPAAELEPLLASNNAEPPTTIQTNTTKITPDALAETLAAQGVTVEPHPWLGGCFTLRGTGDLEQLNAFRDGLFLVQDTASRLVVLAAQPEAGQQILDACGAPGGKSFSTAIAMGDNGSILSCDIHPGKVKQIAKGAKRLGLTSIQSQVRNAKEHDPALDGQFDLVLADAPCSGLGIIRKKPDIRNKDPEPLKDLPRIQGDILENVSRYVKSGGVLVYSTCTVLERENQDVVQGFLARHPEFALEPFPLPGAIGTVEAGMLTLWPHIHGTDGFFLSKMRKQRT